MNMDTAREAVGAEVVYIPRHDARGQRGIITGVSGYPGHIMVRFGKDAEAKATPVELVEFFHVLRRPVKMHRQADSPSRCLTDGSCARRHDWLIICSCGRQFYTGKLKYSRSRAEAHQRGRGQQ